MSLSPESLSHIPASYATVSIGTPHHPLREKLEAIAAAGFPGIELGFPDLLSFASDFWKEDINDQDFDRLCEAGKQVKAICEDLRLKIVMLQPFANFEGWAPHSEERKDAFRRANGWIRIMGAVGTDMLQVGH
jgi:sugar phosphate isomerase/epimerase